MIKGVPFTEQDQRNAMAIAKEKWPGKRFIFVDSPEYPFQFIAPFVERNANSQPQLNYRPQRNHPDIDTLMHQRQVKAIRANYARKTAARKSGAKKTGGKRRR